MHSRISDDGMSGKTIGEFPVIYYTIGKIWSVTGVQIWIYRLFGALLCVIALTCLYKTLLHLTGNWFWSVLGPLLLMASPVYAYYGISFLTNVPAFNCVLIAWYFFYRYYTAQKTKHFAWAILFFTLAGLLKISALTSFLMLCFVFLLEFTRIVKFGSEGKLFPSPLRAMILLAIPLLLCGLWYGGYVEHYLDEHHGRYSFTSPVPAWTESPERRADIWEVFVTFTAYQVYPPYIWFFFLGGVVFLFTQFRKINHFWLVAIPTVLIGHVTFCVLFYFCLDSHDYYHTDFLIFFVLVYAALVKYGADSHREKQQENSNGFSLGKLIASGAMFYLLLSCGSNLHLRFLGCHEADRPYTEVFANSSTINLLQNLHDLQYMKQPYLLIGAELTKRGFSDTVPVIAINDPSFNNVLVMIDHPGYSNLGDVWADSASTAWRIERGAQLLLVEDAQWETRSVSAFMGYLLFKAGHIGVYDLRPYTKTVGQ